MERVVLLTDREHEILHRRFPSSLLPPRYDSDLSSGRPVKEFVALARLLRERGFELFPVSRPPYPDGQDPLKVIRIGKSDIERDLRLMRQYGSRNVSEWNPRNLETLEH